MTWRSIGAALAVTAATLLTGAAARVQEHQKPDIPVRFGW